MRYAIDEARIAAEMDEVPVGCVIIKGNLVIARAHNLRETRNDPTAHAEILALRAAGAVLSSRRLTGTTVYVTVEPCPMCMSAIMLAGVERLVYGAKDSVAGAVVSQLNLPNEPAFRHEIRVTGGIMEEECSAMIADFFKGIRI